MVSRKCLRQFQTDEGNEVRANYSSQEPILVYTPTPQGSTSRRPAIPDTPQGQASSTVRTHNFRRGRVFPPAFKHTSSPQGSTSSTTRQSPSRLQTNLISVGVDVLDDPPIPPPSNFDLSSSLITQSTQGGTPCTRLQILICRRVGVQQTASKFAPN